MPLENPYEVPQSGARVAPDVESPRNEDRNRAIIAFRIATFLLLFPAAFNLYEFNQTIFGGPIASPKFVIYQAVNWMWLFVGGVVIWFAGHWLLEKVTRVIYLWQPRRTSLDEWNSALHRTLRTAPILAFLGAVIWAFWVVAFYQWQLDFMLISIPIGLVANALGAMLYGPLIYRWYKLG